MNERALTAISRGNARRFRKATEPSEAQIQQTCTQLLELDGWRALRTDPVSRREWGKGFGEKGMADYLYIRYAGRGEDVEAGPISWVADAQQDLCRTVASVMWIEWKRVKSVCRETQATRATKAANHQRDWHTLERKRGALTLIAGVDFEASIEGFTAWYKASGLCRSIK